MSLRLRHSQGLRSIACDVIYLELKEHYLFTKKMLE